MTKSLAELKQIYANLLIKIGVNLQPGQGLFLGCEPVHREFARDLTVAAYRAGARHVELNWMDSLIARARFQNATPEAREYFPRYEVERRKQLIAEGWASLRISGEEFPGFFDDVDPSIMRHDREVRMRNTAFYADAQMADQIAWCVCAAPTVNWARKVFPHLSADEAVDQLWHTILRSVRADAADPIEAWKQHDQALSRVAAVLMRSGLRELHFVDSVNADDGHARTDLTVGLVDEPIWVAASAVTPDGIRFLPNMPTEEIFTTPHRMRTHGHVRLSKPAIIMGREVRDAYFRFENGEVVDFSAVHGQDTLAQLMSLAGAKQLGEVALVDVRSPINQTGLLFYDGLFDENAVCHIAFGKAYPTAVRNGTKLSADDLLAAGANNSDAHEDLMIGTSTMRVTGHCADGTLLEVMRAGMFVI